MPATRFDDLHNHATWGPLLRPEAAENGRLHRHRVKDRHAVPQFTSWVHNGPNHSHRLPDGAWTRPRYDLRPSMVQSPTETIDERIDRERREARERTGD